MPFENLPISPIKPIPSMESIDSSDFTLSTPRSPSRSPSKLKMKRRLHKITVLFCLWMAYACSFKFVSTYNSALPILPFSNSQSSLILAFGTGSTMLSKFVSGWITDRVGGWKIMVFSLLIQAISGIVFAVSPQSQFWSFIASWSVLRLAMSFYWASQTVIMQNWFSEKEYGTVSGIVTTASDFTDMISCLIIGMLIDKFQVSWRFLFLITSLFIVLVVALLFIALKQSPESVGLPSNQDESKEAYLATIAKQEDRERQRLLIAESHNHVQYSSTSPTLDAPEDADDDVVEEPQAHPLENKSALYALLYFFTSPRFWLVCANTAGLTAVLEALNWNRVVLKEKNFSEGTSATLSSVFYLSSTACILLGGWMYDHLSHLNRASFMTACNLGIAIVAGVVWVLWDRLDKWWVFVAIVIIQGGYTPAYYIPSSAFSMSFGGPSHCGMLASLIDAIGYLGGVIFDVVLGKIFERADAPWPDFFFIISILSLFSAFAIFAFLSIEAYMHRKKVQEAKLKLIEKILEADQQRDIEDGI